MQAGSKGSAVAPVIVVSTGRCGSTLLSNMIQLHPRICSISEYLMTVGPGGGGRLGDGDPAPVGGAEFWTMLSEPRKRWTLMHRLDIAIDEVLYQPGPPNRYTLESGVPPVMLITLPHLSDEPEALFDELAEWAPGLDAQPIGVQQRRLFEWLRQRFDRDMWFERSGSSLSLLQILRARFPDARFIHMYRDGRDCALSMRRHHAYRLTFISRHLKRHLGIDPYTSDEAPKAPPSAALRPYMPETFNREKYQKLPIPLEDMGESWSNMIVQGFEPLSTLEPDRLTHLRFETLTAHPTEELRRLARFMGMAEDEEWLRRASALARPQRARWLGLPEAERRRLIESCAPGMKLMYGSATDEVEPEPPETAGSFPSHGALTR